MPEPDQTKIPRDPTGRVPRAACAPVRNFMGFANSQPFWFKGDAMAGRRAIVSRGRRRIGAVISSAMQPGPQPPTAVESRSRQQLLRRRHWRARANVVRVIASLLRLGVLPLSTVSQATDVARLTLLAGALRREKLPEEVVLGILMLDWAARAPDLTANFMETVRRRGARLKKLCPKKILSMYTKSATQTDWKTFWHGPT